MKFPRFVAHTHDLAFRCPSRDFEIRIGESFFFDDKAVVSGCIEWVLKAFENSFVIMMDGRDFAMHDTAISNHFTAEGMSDTLMAKANAKNRKLAGKSF